MHGTGQIHKNSSGDELPERYVTYPLAVYLFTTEFRMRRPLQKHSSK